MVGFRGRKSSSVLTIGTGRKGSIQGRQDKPSSHPTSPHLQTLWKEYHTLVIQTKCDVAAVSTTRMKQKILSIILKKEKTQCPFNPFPPCLLYSNDICTHIQFLRIVLWKPTLHLLENLPLSSSSSFDPALLSPRILSSSSSSFFPAGLSGSPERGAQL